MVGKTIVKKQLVSRHEKPSESISIPDRLFSSQDETIEKEQIEWKEFLNILRFAKTSNDQMQQLQINKRKFRTILLDIHISQTIRNDLLQDLLYLYLHPHFFPFHTAIEWIVSSMQELRSTWTDQQMQNLLLKVSQKVWEDFIERIEKEEWIEQNVIQYWMVTFNTFVTLQREFTWLPLEESIAKNENAIEGLTVSSLVTVHQLLLKSLLHRDHEEKKEILVARENIQFISLVTDILRNLAMLLKPFLALSFLTSKRKTMIMDTFGLTVRLLEEIDLHASKDLVANTGQLVIVLFLLSNLEIQQIRKEDRMFLLIQTILTPISSRDEENSNTTNVQDTFVLQSIRNIAGSVLMQSSLIRGLLFTYEASEISSILTQPILVEFMLTQTLQGDTNTQLFQLQTLTEWIKRLKQILLLEDIDMSLNQIRNSLVQKLTTRLWPILKIGWAHPNRSITHMIPDVFQNILEIAKKDLSLTHLYVAAATEDSTPLVPEYWNLFLEGILSMPSYHRSKYEALSQLLAHVTVQELQSFQPNLFDDLLLSMRDRSVASSVSSLWIQFSEKALKEAESSDFSVAQALRSTLCSGLTSKIQQLRSNITDYLLPEICTKISLYFSPLSLLHYFVDTYLPQHPSLMIASVNSLWPIVVLLWQCKLTTQAIEYEKLEKSLELEELRSKVMAAFAIAAVHQDINLRLTALITISASLKTTMSLYQNEINLMKSSLVYSLKTSDVDECSKISRALRQWLLRAKLSSASLSKSLKGKRDPSIVTSEAEISIYEELMQWLFSVLISQWTPTEDGYLPADKEFALLTVLSTIMEVASSSSKQPSGCSSSSSSSSSITLDTCAMSLLRKYSLPKRLLMTFLSNYEKCRKLAFSLIAQIPIPWPGYEEPEEVKRLLLWCMSLLKSAKLKESNAGAQLISVLFQRYSYCLGWSIIPSSSTLVESDEVTIPTSQHTSVLLLINYLCTECNHIILDLGRIFRQLKQSYFSSSLEAEKEIFPVLDVNFPVAQGFLLALRYCVTFLLQQNTVVAFTPPILRNIMKRIFLIALSALESGMEMIAHPIENADGESGTKGPVGSSVALSMAATYVNTNTFSALECVDPATEEGDAGEGSEEGLSAQRAIVAAWLLVKESTSLLAAFAANAPIPSENDTSNIITATDLQLIGERLLDALGRLKHMGAIAEAYTALQLVASSFLRYGQKHSYLSNLPFVWLQQLIERLNYQQVFILRRSAGFAYSFLAILHGEPLNAQPVLLVYAMQNLITIIEHGILSDSKATVVSSLNEDWKLSVHALNVVRLILLDSAFHGRELDGFIPRIMKNILIGFSSTIWSIRNSCMMAFSSIVQRMVVRKEQKKSSSSIALQASSIIDHMTISAITNLYSFDLPPSYPVEIDEIAEVYQNEKPKSKVADDKMKEGRRNRLSPDIGGMMNVKEFFDRFPDLLPFFLQLLSEEVQNSTINLSPGNNHGLMRSESEKHSLYAILLLFSKFTIFASSHSQPELPIEVHEKTGAALQVGLFLPVVEVSLFHHSNPHVRTTAAKAYSKILPVNQHLITIIKKIDELSNSENYRKRNIEIHGRLLQILELLSQFTNYCMLYPSSLDLMTKHGTATFSRIVSIETFHTAFFLSLQQFIHQFLKVSFHSYHSLVTVQLLHQYAILLDEILLISTNQDSYNVVISALTAVQNEKYRFLAHYILFTVKFQRSAAALPYFPYNLQYFIELLSREQPFFKFRVEKVKKGEPQANRSVTSKDYSIQEVSWLEFIVREKCLFSMIREAQIGLLSGLFSYLQQQASQIALFSSEKKDLMKSFVEQVVERCIVNFTTDSVTTTVKDDPVLVGLLLKFLHCSLQQHTFALPELLTKESDRLVNYIFYQLFLKGKVQFSARERNNADPDSIITYRRDLLDVVVQQEKLSAIDLFDQNQVPYLIEIVTILLFAEPREANQSERMEAQELGVKLWKALLLLGKDKEFNSSIRYSVIRSMRMAGVFHHLLHDPTSCSVATYSVAWTIALIAFELLQDDDDEIRGEANSFVSSTITELQAMDNRDGNQTNVVDDVLTVEIKTTENIFCLFQFILSSLEKKASIDQLQRKELLETFGGEFISYYEKYSCSLKDLQQLSTSASSIAVESQRIFEAEKANLYVDVIALQRNLVKIAFKLLVPSSDFSPSGNFSLSTECIEQLVKLWIRPWVLKELQHFQTFVSAVLKGEIKIEEVETSRSFLAGTSPKVYHFIDLKMQLLRSWCECQATSSTLSTLKIDPQEINASILQILPFLQRVLMIDDNLHLNFI